MHLFPSLLFCLFPVFNTVTLVLFDQLVVYICNKCFFKEYFGADGSWGGDPWGRELRRDPREKRVSVRDVKNADHVQV